MSKEELRLLTKALQKHFLFSGLEDEERELLTRKMRRSFRKHRDLVFRQGDVGDCLYVLGSGQLAVEIDDRPVKHLPRGALFGELALLYNVARTATVRVTSEQGAVLWRLDGATVASTLKQLKTRSQAQIISFLESDPNFKSLSAEEREALSSVCTIQEYNAGDTILREGEVSEWMFIVMSGKVMTRDCYGNYDTARKHDFLGSLYNRQQISSAKAPEKVKLLSFGLRNIERLYGIAVETVLKQAVLKNGLSKTSFFNELLPAQQKALMDTFVEETGLAPGAKILSKNSPPQLLVVIEGTLEVVEPPPTGNNFDLSPAIIAEDVEPENTQEEELEVEANNDVEESARIVVQNVIEAVTSPKTGVAKTSTTAKELMELPLDECSPVGGSEEGSAAAAGAQKISTSTSKEDEEPQPGVKTLAAGSTSNSISASSQHGVFPPGTTDQEESTSKTIQSLLLNSSCTEEKIIEVLQSGDSFGSVNVRGNQPMQYEIRVANATVSRKSRISISGNRAGGGGLQGGGISNGAHARIYRTGIEQIRNALLVDIEGPPTSTAGGTSTTATGQNYGETTFHSKSNHHYQQIRASSKTKLESIDDLIKQNEVFKVLKEIFIFKSMPSQQLKQVVSALSHKTYKHGEYVFKQGDPSDAFYLIKSGSIEVSINLPSGNKKEQEGEAEQQTQLPNTLLQDYPAVETGRDVAQQNRKVLRTLGAWDYLGERGLLLNESRSANCRAISAVGASSSPGGAGAAARAGRGEIGDVETTTSRTPAAGAAAQSPTESSSSLAAPGTTAEVAATASRSPGGLSSSPSSTATASVKQTKFEQRQQQSGASEQLTECLLLDKPTFLNIVGNFRKVLEHRIKLQDSDIQLKDLEPLWIVGKGTFGVVKLCAHKNDKTKQYALKCVNKQAAVRLKQQKSLLIEREINGQCFHPCIVQFIKTLQDRNTIYFLTEFLGGGDLFLGIRAIGMLSKKQCQFYSASILLALEYLHERKIIYRDLKPENVLLDFEGRAKLVDFGCCKQNTLRAYTVVGTPEYLAPEVLLGKGYSFMVDFWSLGIVMYEFICGPLPFGSSGEEESSQMELFRQILETPVKFPHYVHDEDGVSILSALLEKIPDLRLGAGRRKSRRTRTSRVLTSTPAREGIWSRCGSRMWKGSRPRGSRARKSSAMRRETTIFCPKTSPAPQSHDDYFATQINELWLLRMTTLHLQCNCV
ncbi:unnamed protein product [Amoebophrya sp. A120]|nr:unnamed protein product [Amoebophrya sp. A120]|eukprot:GSA120T00016203001.1